MQSASRSGFGPHERQDGRATWTFYLRIRFQLQNEDRVTGASAGSAQSGQFPKATVTANTHSGLPSTRPVSNTLSMFSLTDLPGYIKTLVTKESPFLSPSHTETTVLCLLEV